MMTTTRPCKSRTRATARPPSNAHAGCDFVDILKAVGFYGTRSGETAANAPTAPPQPRQRAAKELPKPRRLPNRETDTRYDYHDANGELVFVVIRHDWPSKAKTFSQWLPTEKADSWLPTAPVGQRPMYGLPDIGKTSGSVGVVEGEKCCLAVREAWPNRTYTTWAGGTNAWKLTDWTPLAGYVKCLYVADADEPGHKAMRGIGSASCGLWAAQVTGLHCRRLEWDSAM